MAILPNLLVSAAVLQDALVDKDGQPLAGGVITLYQDNSRTTLKNWYYQSGSPGNYMWIPLPNPLTLSASGTITDANGNDVIPFFYPWFTDITGQSIYQSYYITVYNSMGELQFTRANFPFSADQFNPGPPSTPTATLQNLIINNRFWRNVGINLPTIAVPLPAGTIPLPAPYNKTPGYIQNGNFGFAYNDSPIPTPPGPPNYYYITLAPSQNDGFSMPDFNYIKNAVGGSETIAFLKFPSTTLPALQGDVMPEFYLEHVCGSQDTGVSIKVYQYPISLHLDTLAGQTGTITIQARSNTDGTQLTLALYQFQGTGNTSFQSQPVGVFSLSTAWQKYTTAVTFGNNLNVSNSLTGDDAWYLQIGMPVTGAFQIDFTLPSLYLTIPTGVPTTDFQSYDQIDTVISKPRTGDLRTSINQFYPYGWVPMNNGTIGNNTTVPTPANIPTTRNNIDTWPLFNLIWNLFGAYSTGTPSLGTNPIAPMYLTGTVATQVGYGPNVTPATTALSDWNAGRQLSLTKSMGQVMLGTVPITALLPPYAITYTSAPNTITITSSAANIYFNGMPVYIVGTGVAMNVIYYISNFNGTNNFTLSSSFANAIASPAITIGIAAGAGTIYSALAGTIEGEYSHIQTLSELLQHTHNPLSPSNAFTGRAPLPTAGAYNITTGGPNGTWIDEITTGGITGSSGTIPTPTNNTQPGTFNNIYIKL